MNLRSTTLLIVGLTFAGLALVLTVTLRVVLLRHANDVEQQNVLLNLERAQAAIDSDFAALESSALDIAAQADVVSSVPDGDSAALTAAIDEINIPNQLALLLVLDTSSQLLFGSLRTGESAQPVPEALAGQLAPDGTYQSGQSQRGTSQVQGQPLLLVTRALLDAGGKPVGMLIVGRWLDASELLRLGEIIQLPIDLIPYTAAKSSDELKAAQQAFNAGEASFSYAVDESRIAGYSLLDDLHGKPAYLVRIEQSRLFYLSSKRTMNLINLALVVVGMVFAISTILFLELMVFARLGRLSREVNAIRSSDFSLPHVTVSGHDELSRLGQDINGMLDALEQAQARRLESEHRFQILVESMHDLVFMLDIQHGTGSFYGTLVEALHLPRQAPLEQLFDLAFGAGAYSFHQGYIQRCMQGQYQVYEWSAERDGRHQAYQTSLSPIKDGSGRITGIVGVGREITALKAMEGELRQRVDELTALNEASLLLLSRLDAPNPMESICRLAVEKFGARLAWIGTPTPERTWIEPVAAFGCELGSLPRLPFGTQEDNMHPDAAARALWSSQVVLEPASSGSCAGQVHVKAAFPLLIAAETLSVLSLESTNEGFFSPNRLHTLEAFSNLASIALQNAQLFRQVRNGRKRLEILSRRLVEYQEEERRRIALELHDEIGQILTGLNLMLSPDLSMLPPEVRSRLENARKLVNELIGRVRQMSLTLRPAMLDDLGLLPTLLWHFGNYTRQTSVRVDFHHSDIEGKRFMPAVETAVYRVVQEALTNVARHARVKEVTVQVWCAQGIINVQVEDAGAGFDPEAAAQAGQTLGLLGMQERAIALRGVLTVDSQPGRGTSLLAQIPLEGALERRNYERNHPAGR